MSKIRFHVGDISEKDAARYDGAIAIDTETLGLVPQRDRLCLVQLSPRLRCLDPDRGRAKKAPVRHVPFPHRPLPDPSHLSRT